MDLGNRILWTVVGLILLAAGGLVTAAGLGALPAVGPDTALLPGTVLTRWRDWGGTAWAVVIAAGVVLAVLGVLLLRAELRNRGGRPMSDLHTDDLPRPDDAARRPGATQVRSAALVHGIEHDLARHPKVRGATVLLTGDAVTPHLRTRLDVAAGADLVALRRHVTDSLARFTTTTGLRPASVRILVHLNDSGTARVR